MRYKYHDIFISHDVNDIFLKFVGKNVVVLGPGEAPTRELEAFVRSADILVLINKGYRSGHFLSLAKRANSVFLFHCLNEDEERGGGVIDLSCLAKINLQGIIYPLSDKKLHHHYSKASHKVSAQSEIITVNKKWYDTIVNQLDGYRPNTGFAALVLLIQSNCKHLYIHGFTFFRTPYQSSYRSNLPKISDAINVIESGENHNPDKDLILFKNLIRNRSDIQLSAVMKSILNAPFEPIFYLNSNK